MGWHDRDYHLRAAWRERVEALGVRRPPTATALLMIVHAAAFLVMAVLKWGGVTNAQPLLSALDPGQGALGVLLYPLASANILGVLFTVVALWSLGGRLEPIVGLWRFVGVYAGASVLGGLAYHVLAGAAPPLADPERPLDYPVAALAALCVIAWRHLRFELVNVLGKWISAAQLYAGCAAVVIALVMVTGRLHAVAWLGAVVAGAAVGWASEQLRVLWRAPRSPHGDIETFSPPPRVRGAAKRPPARRSGLDEAEERELDALLAKIGRGGMGSLSAEELERLESLRLTRLHRGRG